MQVEDTAIPGKELNSDGYDDDDQQNCIQFSVPTELLDFHHHVSLQMSRRTSRGRMLRLECRIPLQGAKVSVDISRWYVAHTKNGRPKRSVLVSHTLRQQKGVALIKSLSIPKLISLGSIIPVNTKVHSTLFWQSFPSSQSLAHAQESPPSPSPPQQRQQRQEEKEGANKDPSARTSSAKVKQESSSVTSVYSPNPDREQVTSIYAGVGSLVEKPGAFEQLTVVDIGTLILTSYRLLFIPYKSNRKEKKGSVGKKKQHYTERILQIPVSLIDNISDIRSEDLMRPCPPGWALCIKCRNGQSHMFFLGNVESAATQTTTSSPGGSVRKSGGCCGLAGKLSAGSPLEVTIESMYEELETEISWLSKEQLARTTVRGNSWCDVKNSKNGSGVGKKSAMGKRLHAFTSHVKDAKKAAFAKKKKRQLRLQRKKNAGTDNPGGEDSGSNTAVATSSPKVAVPRDASRPMEGRLSGKSSIDSPVTSASWSRELLENPMGDFVRLNCFTNGWRVTTANKGYKLCSTYPRALVVPDELEDEILFSAAKYRSRNRLPILSWRSKNSNFDTSAVLCRCSQPMTGVTGKTSRKDEMLLYALCARGTRPDVPTENNASGTKIQTMGRPRQSHIMWDRGGDEAKAWWKIEAEATEEEGEDDHAQEHDRKEEDDEGEIFDETYVLKELDEIETKGEEQEEQRQQQQRQQQQQEQQQQQPGGEGVGVIDVVPSLDPVSQTTADSAPFQPKQEMERDDVVAYKKLGWEVEKKRSKQKRLSTVKVGNGLLTDMLQGTPSLQKLSSRSFSKTRSLPSDNDSARPSSIRKTSITSREDRASSENYTSLEFSATFLGSNVQEVQLNDEVVSCFDIGRSMKSGEDDDSQSTESKKTDNGGTKQPSGRGSFSPSVKRNKVEAASIEISRSANKSVSRTESSLLIADARPKINAIANKLKGKGYENTSTYKEENIELKFMGIGNIHVMRNSQRKIFGSLESGNWRSTVQKSNWLSHVQRVLASACRVAAKIGSNQSVLVHCSDGAFRVFLWPRHQF